MSKLFSVYLVCLLLFLQSIANSEQSTSTVPSTSPPIPSTDSTQSTTDETIPSTISTTTQSTTDETTAPTTPSTSTPLTTPTSSTSTETTPTTETPAPTTIPPHKITESFTWSSTKLDQNPIVITVPDGYFISVTVSGVNMANGNYLLIEGGKSYSEQATNGRVFANTVEGPVSYLFKTSAVYAYCETANKNSAEEKPLYDFVAVFEVAGDGPTTTVSTTSTTTISVPTTEKGASTYVTVNISGKALQDYNQETTINEFKECVVTMATNYCKDQNIYLTHNITNAYVMISEITRCPYSWPHSETCVQITFKLPIFYNESSSVQDYQLNTQRLEDMWLRWDQLDEQCFSNHSFSVYEEPDIQQSIVWWAIGISVVLLIFIALLWFLKSFSAKVKSAIRKRMRRHSDTKSIISQRESYSSLTPHYLQDHLDTPKLFEG
ncbi:cell wall protein DAN4-like [Tribolium madens]|uniref:cell wall protein DAN4-like n=1 Tax=Tribolium madens TaxID=41895 RepID=UPI001CF72FDB|nr:cell wall protein DAN4-like [Tribolium madens]